MSQSAQTPMNSQDETAPTVPYTISDAPTVAADWKRQTSVDSVYKETSSPPAEQETPASWMNYTSAIDKLLADGAHTDVIKALEQARASQTMVTPKRGREEDAPPNVKAAHRVVKRRKAEAETPERPRAPRHEPRWNESEHDESQYGSIFKLITTTELAEVDTIVPPTIPTHPNNITYMRNETRVVNREEALAILQVCKERLCADPTDYAAIQQFDKIHRQLEAVAHMEYFMVYSSVELSSNASMVMPVQKDRQGDQQEDDDAPEITMMPSPETVAHRAKMHTRWEAAANAKTDAEESALASSLNAEFRARVKANRKSTPEN